MNRPPYRRSDEIAAYTYQEPTSTARPASLKP